ncbi:MAG: YebC/PmpR family DNA-binding transcriptional regulator [Pseudomonadota bacterium]
MSGHSKWSTIKHKKGKADAARGKLFTRLIKEITVAARMGNGDEATNPRLRTAALAARAANMPNDNIDRAIKRGTGELEGVDYIEITYEGYGPEGAAVMVDVVTDNRNRTVSEVRKIFSKFGGKMGEPGSVAWIFTKRGRVVLEGNLDEDMVMEATLEAGADDIVINEEFTEVFSEYGDLYAVKEACEVAGFTVEEAGVIQVPSNTVPLTGKHAATMMRLMEAMDDQDDCQNVWANYDIDDQELDDME